MSGAEAAPIAGPRIDLLDPGSFAHGQPHDQFRWLRAHAPVYRHPRPDGGHYWAITRHADVRAIGRDHRPSPTQRAASSSRTSIRRAWPWPAT